jgi:serine/threonine-protein kinase
LAEAYIVQQDLPHTETYPKAKTAASTALLMDEGLAEAHNALAMSLFLSDWDWAGAEKEFQRALGLNPSYATAHQWYGQFLRAMRRQNYSAEIQRAHELDPLSFVIGGGSGQYGTQYDRIMEAQRKKMELDPNSPVPYDAVAAVYNAKGMYQEAITYFQRAVSLSGGEPRYLTSLGYTYGIAGKRNEALKILEQLKLLSQRRYVSPYDIATVYVGLREKNLAFDWLGKAVANHDIRMSFLTGDADTKEMASISSDPRYAELKRRIGLPQ